MELERKKMSRTTIDLAENSDEPVITRGAGGKAPAHLGQFIDDEAEDIDPDEGLCHWCALSRISCRCGYDIDAPVEEEDLLEGEQGSEEIPPTDLKRSRADLYAGEELGEHPDLAAYFEQYSLTEQQQIAMCRTYANYLSQKVRSRLRGQAGVTGGKYTRTTNSARGKGLWQTQKGGSKQWKRIKARQLQFEEPQE